MNKLLTFKDLLHILDVSDATGRRYIVEDDFPKSVSGYRKKLLFRSEEIEAWIARRQRSPPVAKIEPAASKAKRHANALERLRAKGIKIGPQKK